LNKKQKDETQNIDVSSFSFNFILIDGGRLGNRQWCCYGASLRLPAERRVAHFIVVISIKHFSL
jgi:hypothetical protein